MKNYVRKLKKRSSSLFLKLGAKAVNFYYIEMVGCFDDLVIEKDWMKTNFRFA